MIEIRPLARRDRRRAGDALPLHRLSRPRSEYLVAWEGAEPLGHVCIEWVDPPELQDLWVLPERRGRGIGTALVAAVEERAAARGHGAVVLSVSEANDGAARLYDRLGYRRTPRPPRRVKGTVMLRSGPYEVDDTLLDYEKPLPS